ncbi:MAG TPA: hypothetical protein VFG21_02015 [Xanthomonadaceae bacterium]|nr:hypothetical protein [Xanthomonadaceae bacterium]
MDAPLATGDADLIGAYLRDRLDEPQRRAFERRLLEDATLLEQVELDLLLRQALAEPALLRVLVAALPYQR